jgi:nucleotide-binding universal stress UspA family protein
MTLLVPFDGSELADAALVRATEFAAVFDERVLALSVIPADNAEYARERGWLGPDEPFDLQHVVATLHEEVATLAPGADFRHEVVDRYASAGRIATTVREVALEVEAAIVFIGSENAGRLVTRVSSVGGSIAAEESYDVVIVRDRSPAKIAELEASSPHRASKSEFYVPE